MPVEFPPFGLQASTPALQKLTSEISGWRFERAGKMVSDVWLRTSDGATWLLTVDQRELRPMFEVFTLCMLSMGDLHARWEQWEPPVLPVNVPEEYRQLLASRPAAPTVPTDFEPWPLRSWQTHVVRRVEFVVEGVNVGPTFGNSPSSQNATRPRNVPHSASAFCEVDAGFLFTSGARSLLMAVDWMPMSMLVSQNTAEIKAFLDDCELVSMADYLHRRST